MTENEKPKNVLDDVMRSLRQLYHQPSRFFVNRPQKYSFWSMIAAFVCLCLFAVLFKVASESQSSWVEWWRTLAGLSMLICYISVPVNLVASTSRSPSRVRALERPLDPVIAASTEELALIARVQQRYTSHEIAYALDRLTLVTTQVRARVALVVGALDKVGLFPLAIGAYFSLRDLFKKEPPTSFELYVIIGMTAGLVGVYFMAVSSLRWAQRLDEACLVLKYAGQAKQAFDLPPEVDQTTSSSLPNPH